MMQSYIAVDIETTGLSAKLDKIIEIGAIKVKNGETIDRFRTFVDAGKTVSAEITKLTGITNDMLVGAPSQQAAIYRFVEFCEDLPLLGHNVIFDYSFLKQAAENARLAFERPGVDTLKIARKHLPDLPKRSLEYLCSYFEIERINSHRAYDDALAAKVLYEILMDKYYNTDDWVFQPRDLIYKVKKQGPITRAQKGYLNDLLKYHRIVPDVRIDDMTKNEASRYIDNIISKHGKVKRGGN